MCVCVCVLWFRGLCRKGLSLLVPEDLGATEHSRWREERGRGGGRGVVSSDRYRNAQWAVFQ